jgi:hypothetical protein
MNERARGKLIYAYTEAEKKIEKIKMSLCLINVSA